MSFCDARTPPALGSRHTDETHRELERRRFLPSAAATDFLHRLTIVHTTYHFFAAARIFHYGARLMVYSLHFAGC